MEQIVQEYLEEEEKQYLPPYGKSNLQNKMNEPRLCKECGDEVEIEDSISTEDDELPLLPPELVRGTAKIYKDPCGSWHVDFVEGSINEEEEEKDSNPYCDCDNYDVACKCEQEGVCDCQEECLCERCIYSANFL